MGRSRRARAGVMVTMAPATNAAATEDKLEMMRSAWSSGVNSDTPRNETTDGLEARRSEGPIRLCNWPTRLRIETGSIWAPLAVRAAVNMAATVLAQMCPGAAGWGRSASHGARN